MKSTILVCLVLFLSGCGKSAEQVEHDNSVEGMKVIAKRQHDLRESAEKYGRDDPLPRVEGTSQGKGDSK